MIGIMHCVVAMRMCISIDVICRHYLSSISEHHCGVMTWQTYPSCQSLGSGEAADQYYVPVNKTWRLNERMYGGLTGREWRMVDRIRYGGDKTCQNGQFLSCHFCCSRSWITQCPSLPVPSADAARVGQEGDSRRPKLWTPPNCIQFKYVASAFWCEIQRSCISPSFISLDNCLLRQSPS